MSCQPTPCNQAKDAIPPFRLSAPKSVVLGALGVTKAVLRLNMATESVIKARRDLCRECDEATKSSDPRFAANKGLTNLSRCKLCNCFIKLKTRNADESCPIGKWGAENKA